MANFVGNIRTKILNFDILSLIDNVEDVFLGRSVLCIVLKLLEVLVLLYLWFYRRCTEHHNMLLLVLIL